MSRQLEWELIKKQSDWKMKLNWYVTQLKWWSVMWTPSGRPFMSSWQKESFHRSTVRCCCCCCWELVDMNSEAFWKSGDDDVSCKVRERSLEKGEGGGMWGNGTELQRVISLAPLFGAVRYHNCGSGGVCVCWCQSVRPSLTFSVAFRYSSGAHEFLHHSSVKHNLCDESKP